MEKTETALDIPKQTESSKRIQEGNPENNPQEKQSYMKAMKDVGKYLKEIVNPDWLHPYAWNKMFLAACVLAVGTDALFFYVPIVHDEKLCVGSDKNLKIAAVVMRCFSDIFYVIDIYYQTRNKNKLIMANCTPLNKIITKLWPYLYISTDILGVLPVPQVVILLLFSKLRGTRSLDIRKFLNFLVFGQYVLRILRMYLSIKELKMSPRAPGPVVKGVLNFFLYVTASHVFGAFWYFLSVQRQTACWHNACRHHSSGCVSTSFDCNDDISVNQTILNDFCPINPPDATVFDFGIFLEALQLGVLGPMDFTKKFLQCYWWGLRNLSSFGQNLKTSTYAWETWFAILVSVIGLLLFLYLIGNLQTYMQLATTKSEERRQTMKIKEEIKEEEIELISPDKLPEYVRIELVQQILYAIQHEKAVDLEHVFSSFRDQKGVLKEELELTCRKLAVTASKKHEMQVKELSANLWMQKNMIPENMKGILLQHVRCKLEDNKDIDVKNLLSILPIEYKESLKKLFCLAALKKMPILRNMGVKVLESFICYLKPVVYSEHSYIIRKGEPLDLMLFITQGVVWSYAAKSDDDGSNYGFTSFKRLERGDYYGEELLKETLTSPDLVSSFPISSLNVKSHTKVEALVLTANDLMAFKSKHDWLFTNKHLTDPTETKSEWASHAIQNVWRRHVTDHRAQTRPLLH